MARAARPRPVDRRGFLHGQWAGVVEIASFLVQVRPERLDAVARAIASLPGAEVHQRDARGKLVVVVEAADAGGIAERLDAIAQLPGVLTAALVFHATDDA